MVMISMKMTTFFCGELRRLLAVKKQPALAGRVSVITSVFWPKPVKCGAY
jgi:hypothetical protein